MNIKANSHLKKSIEICKNTKCRVRGFHSHETSDQKKSDLLGKKRFESVQALHSEGLI